jgi:hypothetical protein
MAVRPELAALATEMAALESETFEIKDYATNDGALLIVSTCDSSSCSSSTCTSTTSCSG